MKHMIHRTSPKGPGMKFIGWCPNCGLSGVGPELALVASHCPNTRGISEEVGFCEALTGQIGKDGCGHD